MFRHIKVLIGLTGRTRTERKWRAKETIGPKQHWAEPIFGIALIVTRSIVVISCNGNPSGMLYTKSACLAIHIQLISPVEGRPRQASINFHTLLVRDRSTYKKSCQIIKAISNKILWNKIRSLQIEKLMSFYYLVDRYEDFKIKSV